MENEESEDYQIDKKARCLFCTWKGTYDEAKFEQSCADGCCYDYFCPVCEGPIVDIDYNGQDNQAIQQ